MTRLAGLDLRRGRHVVHSSSLTVDGLWIANGVFELLDDSPGDKELGAAVRRMLDASRDGVPTPDLRGGPSLFAPVLDALGLRSWATYAKGAVHVDVEQDGEDVLVSPTRNGGREGFVGLTEQSVRLAAPDDEELGVALRAALGRSS
ncbi:hypothetical protein [Micromonospora siamensis]|uniref:Uncharacterized protein n=1 Tax=Micromonospora siamensis TaxID=299152 RepID=A0A1C5HLB8_9ACTN|nr:hypothetical protein [Micromonospora siamensis]SCG46810.1 hypothetical protein GA0074704_1948 [Micromonospora siamensis]